MKVTNKAYHNRILWLFLLPSLSGFLMFYLIPFLLSFVSTVTDQSFGRWIGFAAYAETLSGSSFRLAFQNTLVFLCLCIPLTLTISLAVARGLTKAQCLGFSSRFIDVTALIFLMPLVVPSGSVVYVWETIFSSNGLLSKHLLSFGVQPRSWFQTGIALPLVTLMFLWKNIGYSIILNWTGLNLIPRSYYETAMLEGASRWQMLRHVTLVYLAPTTFVVVLMTVVHSFKSFREIFLLLGAYPPPTVYMLQHYMSNQFLAMDLQKLSVSSWVLTLLTGLGIWIYMRLQARVSENIKEREKA